ncbi:TonB-dependent receptor [Stenotrophomonas sp. YIM B06876]|uniref:TonB-dependent receptor domain-containing protein n=1 Tax=Stenotrophomonas sp. YIM B06876 TaxID=3060211 RepID=UPI0027383A96|nr:TonB-dependent receptor [Stenotrophomonas sp. YIM B06876]
MHVKQSTSFKRSALTTALLTAILVPGAAFAQGQQNPEQAAKTKSDNATNLDRVSVVGSRIKRVDVEGPAPVTVITRADIDREGFQTVGDMLQSLTQQSTANFTGDLAVTGFTPNAQVVNLRGLGPGYTLTLINGRRPAQYPQPYNRDNNVVNIKAIPTAIVERIEVLSGGASAIYGSDAVAGVVNIVTRKNYDGNQLRMTAGTTEEGGGDSVNFEYTGGTTGDRWSAMYSLQYTANEPVFADQRHTFADLRNNPYGLTINPALSLIAISAGGLNGHVKNQNALYNANACDAFGYTTVTTPARGTYCGSYKQAASRSLFNKNSAWAGYVSGTFDATDSIQLFGSASAYTTDAKSSGGTEFWGTSGDRFTTNSAGTANGVYYDAALKDIIQLQRVFNPFELGGNEAASTVYDETTYELTFGATGTLADRFDWEASANYGKYKYEADRPRLLAKAVHDYFLGPLQGYNGSYQVYTLNQDRWNTPITPDIYRSFATRVKNQAETTSSTVNFNVSGDLFELPAGPLGFAAVIEGTRQTTDLVSDYRTSQTRPLDQNTIYNLTSSGETHGSRDRYAVGAEFRVPIFSNLSMNVAGRWDKYDDITAVDDAKTVNLGLEWRPFSNLLLRGSYATSFRAPDMQMVYAEGAASYSTVLDEYACRSGNFLGQTTGPRTIAQCNKSGDVTLYSTQSLIAGNPMLKEEEGKSWGAGFVWDIVDNMSLSVDYYRIKLQDQARQLTASYLLQNEANCRLGVKRDGSAYEHSSDSAFCQNLYGLLNRNSAPGTALDGRVDRMNTAYINSALQDVSGIDASFKYSMDTDRLGRFALDLGWTLRLTDKYKQFMEDDLHDYRDEWDYDPRSRVRGSLGWSREDWSATLFGSRLGENLNWAETHRLKPYITYNLQVGKKMGANTKIDFTVVNLTNNQYRWDDTYTSYPYFYSYIGADPMGRRYFISVTHQF